VVTCKIKHLQKCSRAVDYPRLCRGRKNVAKMFYFTCNHGLSGVMSEFTPIYPAEVERLIQQMPAKTSPLDAVPVSLLKQCRTETAVVMANLANVSFKYGRFPNVMKHGIVVPFLKKPGLGVTDLKNFRPITNL